MQRRNMDFRTSDTYQKAISEQNCPEIAIVTVFCDGCFRYRTGDIPCYCCQIRRNIDVSSHLNARRYTKNGKNNSCPKTTAFT